MKQHLTDDETVGFWMPGPPDERTFIRIVNHAQQCIACRERLWNGCLSLRALTHGLAKVLHQALGKPPTPETSASRAPSLTGPEMLVAMELLQGAAARVKKKPEQLNWTSEELFGNSRYGGAEHFAACPQCFSRMTQLYEVAQSVSEGMVQMSAPPEDRAALAVICNWFAQLFASVKQLQARPAVKPEVDIHSCCN